MTTNEETIRCGVCEEVVWLRQYASREKPFGSLAVTVEFECRKGHESSHEYISEKGRTFVRRWQSVEPVGTPPRGEA